MFSPLNKQKEDFMNKLKYLILLFLLVSCDKKADPPSGELATDPPSEKLATDPPSEKLAIDPPSGELATDPPSTKDNKTLQEYLNNKFIVAVTRKAPIQELEKLINDGANINNARDNKGQPALIIVYRHVDILSFLLKKGANPNVTNSTGRTALIDASRTGEIDSIKILVKNGANLDAQNDAGETALMWTLQHNRLNIADFLLIKGANPNITDNQGRTVLKQAKRRSNRNDFIELLKKYNATE